MRRLTSDLRAAWQFLLTGLRRMDKTASLVPSSRFLVTSMVTPVPLDHAQCVVEYGPGTGVITEEILRHLPATAHLHAIELDGDLLQTATRRINDPRLRPHHGSATDAVRLVRESGCTLRADAIFSSLGLALMSDVLRADILHASEDLLAPRGVFMQYAYPQAQALTYQFDQGWSRYNGRKLLENYFREVQSRMVWLNMPPAIVYACRSPFGSSAVTPLPIQRSRTNDRHRRRVGGSRR